MIELTKKETDVLIELIELNLFDIIRKDEEIDNMAWLEAVVSIYKKCKGCGCEGCEFIKTDER